MSRPDAAEVMHRVATEPTLSVEDAAAAFGIGRSTAYAAVAAGEIPSIRIGRRVRVPSNWVREQLQVGAS
ncbi:helix-turn-helix domain-containing protein [Nocardia puris]|uniref:helix-turn-helix domain-containing protein n=1 Tax=Nocardia puris TaxID=208602 RepID=UPI002E21FDBD